VVIDGNGDRVKRDAVQRWIVNRRREYGRRVYMFIKGKDFES
jgi:hypothetical protein